MVEAVTVCGEPFEMQITEGLVVFTSRSGFYGTHKRVAFEYSNLLWRMVHASSTFDSIPLCNIVRMAEIIETRFHPDHASETETP